MNDPVVTISTRIILFIFGICIGSFLNVLIDRLSNGETLWGRSHCDNCKKTLEWYELFPLASFLFQRGKCSKCHTRLSWFYPGIELLTGVVFILGWEFFPVSFFAEFIPQFNDVLLGRVEMTPLLFVCKVLYLGILSTIIVMFFADVKYFIIPDAMQVTFAVCALAIFILGTGDIRFLAWRAASAVIVMAPILFLYLITKGRGMGFGDVKLAANVGLLLGIKLGFGALYIAFILGAVYGMGLFIRRKAKLKLKVPFGPFILAGILIALYFFVQIETFFSVVYGI